MRSLLPILAIVFTPALYSQKNVSGIYYDNEACRLHLKTDSTFEFKFRFDLVSSWSNGTWSYYKDTVYLHFIPVYDTMRMDSGNDTLVLSGDIKSGRIDILTQISSELSSGGQHRHPNPTKLIYKRKRLFVLAANGKLLKKYWYSTARN